MPAIHQLIDDKPRCGAEPPPPLPEGAYTMYHCQQCRIVELETALRPLVAALDRYHELRCPRCDLCDARDGARIALEKGNT